MLNKLLVLLIMLLILPMSAYASDIVWEDVLEDVNESQEGCFGSFSGKISEEKSHENKGENNLVIEAKLSCGKQLGGAMTAVGVMKVSLNDGEKIVDKVFSCTADGSVDGSMHNGVPETITKTLLGYSTGDLQGGRVDFILIARDDCWWETNKSSWNIAEAKLLDKVENDVAALVKLGAQVSTVALTD